MASVDVFKVAYEGYKMEVGDIVYFRRTLFLPDEKGEKAREAFYEVKKIKDSAVSEEFRWEDFYHYWIYTMKDGTQYEYMEENDYMIPYSIERIR